MGDSVSVRQRDARENFTPSESCRHEDSVRGDVYSQPGSRETCATCSDLAVKRAWYEELTQFGMMLRSNMS